MSDTIEKEIPFSPSAADLAAPVIASQTPEEIQAQKEAAEKLAKETAAKVLADKIAARVAELKTYEGKTFARNDGTGLPVKVVKYVGIFNDSKGGSYHAFNVEIPGHARWNPSATDFLNQHHVVDAPVKTETNQEPK